MGLDRTGSQPPRPPLPSPRTASTQQEPPHRCPQLDLPHRHPREHRPHQAAHTPGNSAHTLTRNTGGGGRGGIDHPPPCGHTPTTPPRTPPHPPTRTRQAPRHGHTPTTTGPEDMRHTHPTTRSHRSPPERPTSPHPSQQHTHGRQAVSGPHTHAQPHRRDHHEHHHQPPRHTQVSRNHQGHEAPAQEDTSSTVAACPTRNALTSTNTKHHDDEITENQKQEPRHPRE